MIIQALPLATSSIFEALSAHRGCFWLDSAGGGVDSARGELNGAREELNSAGGLDSVGGELNGAREELNSAGGLDSVGEGLNGARGELNGAGGGQAATQSLLGALPFLTLQGRGNCVELSDELGSTRYAVGAFEMLEKILKQQAGKVGLAVGHLPYDAGLVARNLTPSRAGLFEAPEFFFYFYAAFVRVNRGQKTAWLIARTEEDAQALRAVLYQKRPSKTCGAPRFMVPPPARSNFSKAAYLAASERAREAIGRGELYQLNLAQQFSLPFEGDSAGLYACLRKHNPADYAGYLDLGQAQILSSSPELFLRLDSNRRVRVCPIKGTAVRHRNAQRDWAARWALKHSAKERAELLMITDLLRNDLGSICEAGSVKTVEIYRLESYARVHHLVSRIEGRLREDVGFRAMFQATFPGGSITGAPKQAAMELIDLLEPHARGCFFGSMGYVNFDGSLAFNISIRTCVVKARQLYLAVGSGIVWDSVAEREYEETLHKAAAIFEAIYAYSRHAS